MNNSRSCANCANLSNAERLEFSRDQVEERVVCLRKRWKRGSVEFGTIYEHPATFRERAEGCEDYREKASGNNRIMRRD